MRVRLYFGLLLFAVAAFAAPARADESWQPFNPFAEMDRKKAAKKAAAATPAATDTRPALVPLHGPDAAAPA